MSDSRTIDGSISIQDSSKERVAFDLMKEISYYEDVPEGDARKYFLTLYSKCLLATSGYNLKDVLG